MAIERILTILENIIIINIIVGIFITCFHILIWRFRIILKILYGMGIFTSILALTDLIILAYLYIQ